MFSFISAADWAALRAPRGYRSPFSIAQVGANTATNLAVFESVRNFLEERAAPQRILDLGAGSGALIQAIAEFYQEKGWPVDEYLLGADIDADNYQAKVPFQQMDLFRPLDLQGRTFDLIVAEEVLEHIRRVYPLLEELRQALNPGGRLLFSLPNMMTMNSRLRFLSSGRFHHYTGPSSDWEDIGCGDGHINPLPIQYWDYGLRYAGFSGIRYKTDRFKKGALLWSLLFAPVLWLGTRLLHRQERRHSGRIYRQNLRAFREINTLRNLAGHALIAECFTPDEGSEPRAEQQQ